MRRPEPEVLPRDDNHAPDVGVSMALARAEIDGQIATARAFPRSISDFIRDAKELVTLDVDTAEACIYALPRDGKTIAGPSARFAEILQYCYGNSRGGGRVIAEEGDFIVAQGVYHDLEKNVQISMEVRRRITDKYGKKYKADMIGVTGNAAASIAHRNAVLKGIPKALWLPLYEAARMVAVGDVTTLVDRRGKALSWFQNVNVTPEMVCKKLDVPGIEDIGLPELEILTGLRTAIREGSISPEDAFKPDAESTLRAATSGNVADLGKKVAEKRSPAKKEPEPAPAVESPEAGSEAAPMPTSELREKIRAAKAEDMDALWTHVAAIPDDAVRDNVMGLFDQCAAALQVAGSLGR